MFNPSLKGNTMHSIETMKKIERQEAEQRAKEAAEQRTKEAAEQRAKEAQKP